MSSQPRTGLKWSQAAVAITVLLLVVAAYWQFGDAFSLESLASRESSLREFQVESPVLVYVAAFAIYVAVAGLSLPGAAALTLVFGWYFGFWRGLLLVSFASTAGATAAFFLSRYLFRDAIQSRFGERLQAFNQSLEREGAFYLFTLRLIPAVPFFVVNLVMGLTPVRPRTFWWVSQLGMLPGTAVYVYAGASVPSLSELAANGVGGVVSPQLIIAFVLLGLFPLLVKKLVQKFRPATTASQVGSTP